jgi:hypothetical protein
MAPQRWGSLAAIVAAGSATSGRVGGARAPGASPKGPIDAMTPVRSDPVRARVLPGAESPDVRAMSQNARARHPEGRRTPPGA